MTHVPAVPAQDLDKRMFDSKYRTEMPVLITGLSQRWKAHTRWEPSKLKLVLGDLMVQPFVALDDVHFLENEGMVERREMRFGQVLEHVFEGRPLQSAAVKSCPTNSTPARTFVHRDGTRITTNSSAYSSMDNQVPLDIRAGSRVYLRGALFSTLRADIEVPEFMEGGNANLSKDLSGIWYSNSFRAALGLCMSPDTVPYYSAACILLSRVGSAGCITPLHFDAWHGILCQVRGRKRVTLFSPEDTNNIYPYASIHMSLRS